MGSLASLSLWLGQTEPREPSGVAVLDTGVLGPQGPASSSPPRCSQQHPHLSPGLSSAEMPGPAKPAVPVPHPCDLPPSLQWLQEDLGPARGRGQ